MLINTIASMYEEYKDPRSRHPAPLKQCVRLGRPGRRTRRGSHHYDG
ncbi:hypothetical protein AB0E04_27025 [Streptomyces sp. NPDC048251]